LKIASGNITRNMILSLVSAATIALALFILGAFLLLQVNLQKILESSARGLSVTAYLEDGITPENRKTLIEAIIALPGVDRVDYVSKDEAIEDLKNKLGELSGALEGLDENPLPSSLELTLAPEMREKERIQALVRSLEAQKTITEVHYAWEWAEKLGVIIEFIKMSGIIAGMLLFMVIVFIIANTIKLTVMARMDELYIMRLMGATEGFVRAPFFIEGLAQGLTGGLTALLVLYLFYSFLAARIELPLGFSTSQLCFIPTHLTLFLVLSGAGLGLLGSRLSLGRFMRL
jgi:cell division transport system permease protein